MIGLALLLATIVGVSVHMLIFEKVDYAMGLISSVAVSWFTAAVSTMLLFFPNSTFKMRILAYLVCYGWFTFLLYAVIYAMLFNGSA